jgi:AcrR family transcriptional regulator
MERIERKAIEFNMRRSAILAQAEKAFSRNGYHNVTIAEIAGASGFSIGALYQFFKGKEDLYVSMINEKLGLMYECVKQEVKAAKDLNGKIEALVTAQLRFVEENTDFCRIFLRGENEISTAMKSSLQKKMIDNYFQHLSFIETILISGMEDGILRTFSSRDMAGALSHLIRAAAFDWMLMPSKDSLVSKKDFILDVFFNGVQKHDH